MPFRVRMFLLALVALLATSCKVAVDVSIAVAKNGSGAVAVTATLDDDAKAKVGADLATALHTGDLEATGWVVSAPVHHATGWAVTATKPFGSPDGLQAVLDEIGGKNGVFRSWRIGVAAGSLGSTTWRIEGRVVLSGTLDQFSDPALAQALGGLPLGRTPEQIQTELGKGGTIPLTVKVRLPDDVAAADTNGTVLAAPEGTANWRFELPGKAVDEHLHTSTSETDATPYLWFGLAAVTFVAAVSLWILSRSRARSRR